MGSGAVPPPARKAKRRMRWVVEITSLGNSEKESLTVEAESWQKALQSARAQRGESAPMSGFSIELLDEGCRAVDPTSRRRYEVRRAPSDSNSARSSSSVPAPRPSAAPRPVSHAPRDRDGKKTTGTRTLM